MAHEPARSFQVAAVGSLALGVAMVFALDAIMHAGLPLWLHIPLTIVVLTLLGGSAMAAGVSFFEFHLRSQGNQGSADHE